MDSPPELVNVRERQEEINASHPFGLRLWKSSLYKKIRSIDMESESALMAQPAVHERLSIMLNLGNMIWTLTFGLALALVYLVGSGLMMALAGWHARGRAYAWLLLKLSLYVLYPFGKTLERRPHAEYGVERRAAYRQSAALRTGKKITDIFFQQVLMFLLAPMHIISAIAAFFGTLSMPMYRFNILLIEQLFLTEHDLVTSLESMDLAGGPLALSPSLAIAAPPITLSEDEQPLSMVLCITHAMRFRYLKYTIAGVNVVFINLLPVSFAALIMSYTGIGSAGLIFGLCLIGVIPLAYLMGQAVSSISAQSSLGMGAVLNAIFASVVEILLYCFAVYEKKGELVEGAIIGSLLATLLLLPGLSMIAGGFKQKQQKFNAKSQNVSTVLLVMTLIAAFVPSIFYKIFGGYNIDCQKCSPDVSNCTGCTMTQPDINKDPFFHENVVPLMWICASILPMAYAVGCYFTLRSHVDHIYNLDTRPTSVRPSSGVSLHRTGSIMSRHDGEHGGGHDAPSWSKAFSATVLGVCTVLFAAIAEVLVSKVDAVIPEGGSIKFVGLTLFALVPSVTEFVNAIAFAGQGNIALSLEIGSQYVAQIATLQLPAVFMFAAVYNKVYGLPESLTDSFTLIFPTFDMAAILFSILILSYVFMEGKANYFKGAILTFAYFVFVGAFYYAPDKIGY